MENDSHHEYIDKILDAATIGLAVHGLRVILNPETYQQVDSEFVKNAIGQAEAMGWIKDGIIEPPSFVWQLLFPQK